MSAVFQDNDWAAKKVAAAPVEDETPKRRERAAMYEFTPQYLYRRAFSEMKLLDLFGTFDFQPGKSYNFLTAGDIDGLSYLKAIIRQESLSHCIVSTWCMSAGDAFQLISWIEGGGYRAAGFICRGDFQRILRRCMGAAARVLPFAPGVRSAGNIQKSLKDYRGERRALCIRSADFRQLRHQPADGTGVPVDRRGDLSFLQRIF